MAGDYACQGFSADHPRKQLCRYACGRAKQLGEHRKKKKNDTSN
jgi:hypothetical protein